MPKRKLPNINIEAAQIIYRNFSGKASQYNREGNRNFNVLLEDSEQIDRLLQDGWNIKKMKPREEDEVDKYRLEVKVCFDYFPPNIVLIAGKKKTVLDEESVAALDYAHIINVDLVIRPYEWDVNGKTGIKAYVKAMYVTIERDEFADKYDEMEKDDSLSVR